MAYEHILTETRGRVGIIRFNRPEKLNAMNDQLREETLTQIGVWNEDDSIGAIVVTGEGRAFCSGPISATLPSGRSATEEPRRQRSAPVRNP